MAIRAKHLILFLDYTRHAIDAINSWAPFDVKQILGLIFIDISFPKADQVILSFWRVILKYVFNKWVGDGLFTAWLHADDENKLLFNFLCEKPPPAFKTKFMATG